MTIEEKQQEIIDEFSFLENWMDKYEYLIDLSKKLPEIDANKKTDDNLIEGCQSRVWVDFDHIDDRVFFSADSDAIVPKGIISMLIFVLNGEKPQDILQADLHFIADIGLQEYLSPTRSNGLLNMVRQLKRYALEATKMKLKTQEK